MQNNRSGSNRGEYYGVELLKEKNFSAISTELDLWKDGIPFKVGAKFPSEDMQRRADINKTMDALVSNDLADVLKRYIDDIPDLEPIQGNRVANIVSSLPIFDSIVKTWKLLLTPCFSGLLIRGQEREDLWNDIKPHVNDLVKNMFTACDRATIVYAVNNNIVIKTFTDKNIVLFRTKTDERIVTITNVITEGKRQFLECLSYMPDNTIVRDKFKYGNGTIGEHIVVNETLDFTRSITFTKNGSSSKEYGYPELIGCMAPSLGTVRAFAALARLIEKSREVIRVVPGSSIRKDPVTGQSVYVGNSTIGYDEQNPDTKNEVAFKTPELDFDGVLKALEQMLKQVSIYSGISGILLGNQVLTGNDSGKALLMSCVPTILQANGYIDSLVPEIKRIVVEVARLKDESLQEEDIKLLVTKPESTLTAMFDIATQN